MAHRASMPAASLIPSSHSLLKAASMFQQEKISYETAVNANLMRENAILKEVVSRSVGIPYSTGLRDCIPIRDPQTSSISLANINQATTTSRNQQLKAFATL